MFGNLINREICLLYECSLPPPTINNQGSAILYARCEIGLGLHTIRYEQLDTYIRP